MIDDFRPSDHPAKQRASLDTHKTTENFQTPEEVAAADTIDQAAVLPIENTDEDNSMANYPKSKSRSQRNRRFRPHWPPTKKEWVIIILLLLLIGGGVVIGLSHYKHTSITSIITLSPAKPAKPNTVASRLTGLQVSPTVAQLPVTAVMVENSTDARPQSGLSEAGIIYEALAEGGITRFVALYENNQSSLIGPVRSARPYYIDQLLPFNAAYAHVGGSPDALNEIGPLNVRDMNQFYNGQYYMRVSSRPAPHNVYTTLGNLWTLEQAKHWTTSNFTGFPRKADSPSKSPTVTSIDLHISSESMEVHYQYDSKLNSYLRSEGGSAMTDASTGKQLEPKVVIALVIPWTNGALDASGAYYTDYSDIGSGTAYIFQDGGVTQGVWEKSSQTSQIQFNTASGSAIKLNAGQTWITAVGSASQVIYGL